MNVPNNYFNSDIAEYIPCLPKAAPPDDAPSAKGWAIRSCGLPEYDPSYASLTLMSILTWPLSVPYISANNGSVTQNTYCFWDRKHTHNMTKIKSWVTQSQVFQKSWQLKTMKWAPWATKIVPSFRLLTSACIVQELIANNHRLFRTVDLIFFHAASATSATTTLFRCLCRRNCNIWLWSIKNKT